MRGSVGGSRGSRWMGWAEGVVASALAVGVAGVVAGSAIPLLSITRSFAGLMTGMLLASLFALVAFPFIRGQRKQTTDYFEPIYLVALSYGLYFGLRTLYIFCRPEKVIHQEVFDLQVLNRSLLYVILGFAVLLWGYYSQLAPRLAAKLRLSGIKKEWPERGLLERILMLYSVGLLARWFAFQSGVGDMVPAQYGGQLFSYADVHTARGDYLAHFQEYTEHALLALMLCGLYRKRKMAGVCLMVLWGLELFLKVPTTSKRTFLVLALLVVLWSNYRRRLLAPSRYLLLGLLAAFLVFPWVNTYRAAYAERYAYSNPAQAIPGAGADAWERLRRLGLRDYLIYSLDLFFGRSHGIDSMSLVVQYTPSAHDYLRGKDYLYIIPSGLIPRAIWKSKPFFQSEEIFELYYWRGGAHGSLGGSPGPTMVGDLYMNFGLPGVLLGMFGFGIIYRLLYEVFVVGTGASSPGLLFYFVTFLPLLQIEASVLSFSVVLKKFIYLAIFHFVLKLRHMGN